jgi:hypothetical protein
MKIIASDFPASGTSCTCPRAFFRRAGMSFSISLRGEIRDLQKIAVRALA